MVFIDFCENIKKLIFYFYRKKFGGIKKMLYLCIHKSETSDEFFEIKKVEKRFGRLKKFIYLCKTNQK